MDRSVDIAREMGAAVLELDPRRPFSAARARNEGCGRLRQAIPGLAFVQFIDGDCELAGGWLGAAAGFIAGRPDVAVVCGRLRERDPQYSVYNMLCDFEWDQPPGETRACGGIAMVRVAAFEKAGGFRADLFSGEEGDLCARLRHAGWQIHRLTVEMALHDAAMAHFGQWWTRTLRAGFSFAQAAYLHGKAPGRHGVRETVSAWTWAFGVPCFSLCLAWLWDIRGLCLLLLYPLQVVRLAARGRRSPRENWLRAVFLVLGKFPELLGQLKFLGQRCGIWSARLIEYK
jgi:GT2 family glycosyltransferase